MRPVFYQRPFLAAPQPAATGTLAFTVGPYAHHAVGGPRRAEITATGGVADLLALPELLRCPVEIYDNDGQLVWWGLVNEVRMEVGALTLSTSLDQMANRVAVAYTLVEAGEEGVGVRATTEWAEDAFSVAEYGVRELLDSLSGASPQQAEAHRDRALLERAQPRARLRRVSPVAKAQPSATIYAVGWWETLGWRYASVPVALALAYETGGSEVSVGELATREAVAQSFDLGAAAVNAQAVEIQVRKVGNPTDNLTVKLYTNVDDSAPDTELVSASIDGSTLTTEATWTRFTFSEAEALTAGGTYFLTVERSGAVDPDNYYAVTVDPAAGYANGVGRAYDGTTWNDLDYSLNFRVYDNAILPTSQQIASLLANYGQFFSRVQVEVDSGILTESYRDGDADALTEIETLLESGTSAGVRMLAAVDPHRRVRVYSEPDPSDALRLSLDGTLTDMYGGTVKKSTCPAGVWARIIDGPGLGLDATRMGDASLNFLTETEYDPRTDRLTIISRGAEDDYDMGGAHAG